MFAFFSLACISVASAQDVIIKKDKTRIECKVLEIGLDAIRYLPYDEPDAPVINIAIEEVWKIKFEKGTEWVNTPDPYEVSSAVEVRDHKRAIKYEFFSPLFGKLAFGYEQMIKVGMNMEFKAGIIGPSIGNTTSQGNPGGVFVKGGVKFLFGSEFTTRGVKYAHGLAGKYFKPEIIFSTFEKNYSFSSFSPSGGYVTSMDRVNTTNYGINLVFGKQSIVGNIVTLDWYIGAGYGWQSFGHHNTPAVIQIDGEGNFESNCYSHLYGGPEFPMIFSAGLAIGILAK